MTAKQKELYATADVMARQKITAIIPVRVLPEGSN
jgi:hypothetical protein